jgi:hypothetical protein
MRTLWFREPDLLTISNMRIPAPPKAWLLLALLLPATSLLANDPSCLAAQAQLAGAGEQLERVRLQEALLAEAEAAYNQVLDCDPGTPAWATAFAIFQVTDIRLRAFQVQDHQETPELRRIAAVARETATRLTELLGEFQRRGHPAEVAETINQAHELGIAAVEAHDITLQRHRDSLIQS